MNLKRLMFAAVVMMGIVVSISVPIIAAENPVPCDIYVCQEFGVGCCK